MFYLCGSFADVRAEGDRPGTAPGGDTILLPIYSLYSYTYKYKLLREYKYIKLSTKYYVYGNEKDSAPKSVSSKGGSLRL